MKYTSYTLFMLTVACLAAGCISPYEPKGIEAYRSLLAVDGVIVEGETVIRLSRSIDLGSYEQSGDVWIAGAKVWVEGENGDRFDAVESESWNPGEYRADGVVLHDDVRYRLRISWDGEEYQSEYRIPQSTPPFKDIDFHLKDATSGPLQVRVNVEGEPGTSRHYLLNYKETWEIHAPLLATLYLAHPDDPDGPLNQFRYSIGEYNDLITDDNPENNPRIFQYENWISPYYYCWGYYDSKEILLADTEFLTENKLTNHVLYEIDVASNRLSHLYHTSISLYSIGEDAFYYYTNQKRNTDETGDIFGPIPSEMPGNIVCTSSPEIPAIGFVEVSTRTRSEFFLDPRPYYRPRPLNCVIVNSKDGFGDLSPDSFYLQDIDAAAGKQFYAQQTCLDCRTQGGVKQRPDWWPNNHK
jgi:hypothetical protein